MRAHLLAAVALVACHRGGPAKEAPPPPSTPDAAPAVEIVFIEQVAVSVAAWPVNAGPQPDARQVSARIWEELSQSAVFELARGPRGALRPDAAPGTVRRRARVNVQIAVDRGDKDSLRSVATVALAWAEDDEELAPWASHGCEGPAGKGEAERAAEAATLVDCAVSDAARSMVDKELVRRGDPATVLKALESRDASLRQVALAAISERKIRAAVPRLLEMLRSSDELVRDGAIGALVALREPSAVKPLTELAGFNDLDMMRRIIDAVGSIGGEDARSYLELVASGHELPAVRELAEAALTRLQRRARDGG